MANNYTNSTRLHMRLIPDDLKLLEEVQRLTSHKSKSSVVRSALSFFEQAWSSKKQGYRVVLQNETETRLYEIFIGEYEHSGGGSGDNDEGLAGNFQLRASAEDITKIDLLIEEGAATNRSHLIREALRIYSHIIVKAQEGWIPALRSRSIPNVKLELSVPGLLRVPAYKEVPDKANVRPLQSDSIRLVSTSSRNEPIPSVEPREPESVTRQLTDEPIEIMRRSTNQQQPQASAGEDELWLETPNSHNHDWGVWLVLTHTSCAWPLLYAAVGDHFSKHGVPLRGIVIRKGWLANDLERILGDYRIQETDMVLVQSLLTDLLWRLGAQRVQESEGLRLERLSAITPLVCQQLAISVRDPYIDSLHRLMGKMLAVTHRHSNFLMSLCLAMQEQRIPYTLPEHGFDPHKVNITFVCHSDLLLQLQERRIDAFATVEPYHSYAKQANLVNSHFQVARPRYTGLPDYCCVAAIPHKSIHEFPGKTQKAARAIQEAIVVFRRYKDSASQKIEKWLQANGLETPNGHIHAENCVASISSFSLPKSRVITPNELASEIVHARRFFRQEEFCKVGPATDYEELVLQAPKLSASYLGNFRND